MKKTSTTAPKDYGRQVMLPIPSPSTADTSKHENQKKRNNRTRKHYKKRHKLQQECIKTSIYLPRCNDMPSLVDVHVLVNKNIDPQVIAGLSLGLNFIPTTEPDFSPDPLTVERAVLDFSRRLFLNWKTSQEKIPPFYPASKINTSISCTGASHNAFRIIRQECKLAASYLRNQALAWLSTEDQYKSNIPLCIRKSLQNIRTDTTFTIASADKNMGITVVTTTWYTTKCEEELLKQRPDGTIDYCLIVSDPRPLLTQITAKIASFVTSISFSKFLIALFGNNKSAVQKICLPNTTSSGFANFYGLVKYTNDLLNYVASPHATVLSQTPLPK
jgi:hypothetical protein